MSTMAKALVDGVRVRCDSCQNVFELIPYTFTRRLGEEEQSGFRCPHCGVETIAVRTNEEIRALQAQVAEISRKAARHGHRKLRRKADELRKELRRKLDAFNGRAVAGR